MKQGLTEGLVKALDVTKLVLQDLCHRLRSAGRKFYAEGQRTTFQRAVLARDLSLIHEGAQLFASVGYSPYDIWRLAQEGDPKLNETVWKILLHESKIFRNRPREDEISDVVLHRGEEGANEAYDAHE